MEVSSQRCRGSCQGSWVWNAWSEELSVSPLECSRFRKAQDPECLLSPVIASALQHCHPPGVWLSPHHWELVCCFLSIQRNDIFLFFFSFFSPCLCCCSWKQLHKILPDIVRGEIISNTGTCNAGCSLSQKLQAVASLHSTELKCCAYS